MTGSKNNQEHHPFAGAEQFTTPMDQPPSCSSIHGSPGVLIGRTVLVALIVGVMGVKVGNGVVVAVGVGVLYQRGVIVGVGVGESIKAGVSRASGGYISNMADRQSKPWLSTNSLKRAAG